MVRALYSLLVRAVQPLLRRKLVRRGRAEPGYRMAVEERFGQYDMPALLAQDHPLLGKAYLTAKDFALETLITYPIPDNRMDLFRQVLEPAGVEPKERRTTELTVAILQLVKSRRGIAALPRWAVQPYLERDYVAEMPITAKGLRASLHAATTKEGAGQAFMKEFIETVRITAERQFEGIRLL